MSLSASGTVRQKYPLEHVVIISLNIFFLEDQWMWKGALCTVVPTVVFRFYQVTSNLFWKIPKKQAEKCMPGEHAW